MGGEIFRTRPERPWGPPSLLCNGYRVISGVKRPGSGVDYPPTSSAEVKERVELYLYSPSGPSWPVLGWTLPFILHIMSESNVLCCDYILCVSSSLTRSFETHTIRSHCQKTARTHFCKLLLYQTAPMETFVYLSILLISCGPGSTVGIATEYGLDGPRSNPGGDEIFRPSKPTLGPTQPPVKWVPGLSRG